MQSSCLRANLHCWRKRAYSFHVTTSNDCFLQVGLLLIWLVSEHRKCFAYQVNSHKTFYNCNLLVKILYCNCLLKYSQHPKSGQSSFRMAIFRTHFESVFRMLWPPFCFRKQDRTFLTASLDRFIQKIFFL
jgi:hypothetical protein